MNNHSADGHCINCGVQKRGAFCPECGQKHMSERWTISVLSRQFINQVTNIEKGFIYTAIALFKKPGILISDYWKGRTVNAYNPFRYVLILTAVNLLINFWLGIDDQLQEYLQPGVVEQEFDTEIINEADTKFDSWLNILVLLLLPFQAFITKYLFANRKNNYGEHLIMISFMMGQQSLITSFTHFLFYWFPPLFSIYMVFNFAIGLVYNSYVFKKIFNQGLGITILKTFLLGVVSLAVFFGLVAIAATIALFIS